MFSLVPLTRGTISFTELQSYLIKFSLPLVGVLAVCLLLSVEP